MTDVEYKKNLAAMSDIELCETFEKSYTNVIGLLPERAMMRMELEIRGITRERLGSLVWLKEGKEFLKPVRDSIIELLGGNAEVTLRYGMNQGKGSYALELRVLGKEGIKEVLWYGGTSLEDVLEKAICHAKPLYISDPE